MLRLSANIWISWLAVLFSIQASGQPGYLSPPAGNHAAIERLCRVLRVKTTAPGIHSDFDSAAFTRMRMVLENDFPLVHNDLERIVLNEFTYVYKWEGRDPALRPYVLMAHQDVVPVEKAAEQEWTYPPFSATVAADTIWCRGVVDDKGTLVAILEAAENLLTRGLQPLRSIYFCFGHDEEMAGREGAKAMAEWFREKQIRPALVLDEGLEIIHKNYIPLKKPVALLGIGEKGFASFTITAQAPGGHSAAPGSSTAVDRLVRALNRLHDHPMPARLVYPLDLFLAKIKTLLPGKMRLAISHLWLFRKKLLREMGKDPGANAMVRTTMTTTILDAGVRENVIPVFARATVNCRILPGETVQDAEQHITRVVAGEGITVERQGYCWDPPELTDINGEAYLKIDSLTRRLFPGVTTAPLIVIGYTDARYFRAISDGVINFLPVPDSKGMHGVDERRAVADYLALVRFFGELMMME